MRSPRPARFSWRGRRGRSPRQVQCCYCYQFGHFQIACPMRRQGHGGFSAPPAKKGRLSLGNAEQSKQ